MSDPQDPKDQPKFFQTQDFKALDAKWKQKLNDSGFKDIEKDEDSLIDWASSAFKRRPEYDQSKAEYYRLAGQFLHEYRFRGPEAAWLKRIWELHANGTSIREIVKLLDPTGEQSPHTLFKKVQTALARIAKRMIAKCQKQLNT